MEVYRAMMDLHIFQNPLFLELSYEAQARFAQLVGTSDRMGVANLYQIWSTSRIKADLMESLYKTELVWPVDAYYCFIPSIFSANQSLRRKKYEYHFDTKGFQACINKYPEILQSMSDSEREYIRSEGIILAYDVSSLPSPDAKPVLSYKSLADPSAVITDPNDLTVFEGIPMNCKDYAKYQGLLVHYKEFERRNNVSILSERDIKDWFLKLYKNDYYLDGVKVNDIYKLFYSYCTKVMQNKMIQGTLTAKGGLL